MRVPGVLWFNPGLPDGLRCLEMTIRYRGHALEVSVTHDAIEICARPSNSAAVKLGVTEAVQTLEAGESLRSELRGR